MSIKTVTGILILDNDGKRVCSKFYGGKYSTPAIQTALEAALFRKSRVSNTRGDAEVIIHEDCVCVYKAGSDITFFVVGGANENELMLACVLDTLYDTMSGLLKGQVERRLVLENLELLLLTLDELVDGGIILELDPLSIANRVLMRGVGGDVVATDWSGFRTGAKDTFVRAFGK